METLRNLVCTISTGEKSVSHQKIVGHEYQRQYELVLLEPFFSGFVSLLFSLIFAFIVISRC